MAKSFPVIFMTVAQSKSINGGMSQTTKMPCKSYSLPTESCITGFKMSAIAGSICSVCYANKGNYNTYQNNIKPAQFARLDSVLQACMDEEQAQIWISSIVSILVREDYFRWHDAGDLQSVEHLRLICRVCELTPHCDHWLPTREYGIVKAYIEQYGDLPENLVIRLSAMYPDRAVIIPKSLQGIPGITASNVHTIKPIGQACHAPSQNGECRDCRACWNRETVISYSMH